MGDDESKVDARDRMRVSGGQDYEIQHLAEAYGLDEDVAKMLIERYGNDRERLEQEAKKLRGLGP